jgi:hypothetical protein
VKGGNVSVSPTALVAWSTTGVACSGSKEASC